MGQGEVREGGDGRPMRGLTDLGDMPQGVDENGSLIKGSHGWRAGDD